MTAEEYYNKGVELFYETNFQKAIPYYNKAIEINKDHYYAYDGLGDCYRMLTQYQKAIQYYNKAIEINKDHYYAYDGLGDCYRMLKQYQKAIQYYNKAIEINKDDYYTYNGLGDCYRMLDQYQKAIQYFNKAIEINKDDYRAYYGLGDCYRMLDQYQKAIQYFNKAIEINKDDYRAYDGLGDCYRMLDQYQKAIPYYNKAIEINKDDYRAYDGLGDCYRMLTQYQKAIQYYNKAIEINKDDYYAYDGLGDCYRMLGQYQKAIPYYNKAIEINKDDYYAYKGLGDCYRMLEQEQKAIPYFNKAIEINKGYDRAYSGLGDCYRMLEQEQKAIPYFNKAIEINKDYDRAYYGLGECYRMLDQKQKAIPYYNKAIEINKDYYYAYNGLGDCYRMLDQYQKAIPYYNRAIEINKDDYYTYNGLGECYRMLDQYQKAIPYYNRAIEINKDYGMPYLGLYLIPAQEFAKDEKRGIPLFYTFLYLVKPDNLKINISLELKECLKIDAPILPYQLFGNQYEAPIEQLYSTFSISEHARVSKSFRQQFTLWKTNRYDKYKTLIVEAIMNFYLGNPIRAYQIFDIDLAEEESPENPLPLIAQYYFALSAEYLLTEDHTGCINSFALPQAEKALNSSTTSTKDKYYAALILNLAGKVNESIKVLEELASTGFAPAMYKAASLKRDLYVSEKEYTEQVLNKLTLWYRTQNDYYTTPHKIVLHSEEEMLTKIMPQVHFMENRSIILKIIANRSTYQATSKAGELGARFFFANHVTFSYLEGSKLKKHIRKYHNDTYQKQYGDEKEEARIEIEIDRYNKMKEIGDDVGKTLCDDIHKFAFTDYSYTKNNYKDKISYSKYRFYTLLIKHLDDRELLIKDPILLQEYIVYCANKVYKANPDNEEMKFVLNELKSMIPSSIIGSIGLGTVEGLGKLLYNRLFGKESDVLSFNAFEEIYTSRENKES